MKVLILKLGALGDVIISTSVIRQIEKHHDKDEVTLLTTPSFRDIFSTNPALNIVTFPRHGLFSTLKTILWIRHQKFDRIYDLQSNDRSSIYCHFSGCTFCAGNHPRRPYHVHPADEYIGQCHSFERLNQIIQSAGLAAAESRPYLPVPEKTKTRVNNWLQEHRLTDKPRVLMHAGSSPKHTEKRWPFFAELAQQLKDQFNIIWIGSVDDAEINRSLSQINGHDATGQFSVLELVALGSRCRFAVTNDSAPMHILSCSDIPVFSLFGPTFARRTHALGQYQNVITAQGMIAENDHAFVPANIAGISVDTVINKIKAGGLL